MKRHYYDDDGGDDEDDDDVILWFMRICFLLVKRFEFDLAGNCQKGGRLGDPLKPLLSSVGSKVTCQIQSTHVFDEHSSQITS